MYPFTLHAPLHWARPGCQGCPHAAPLQHASPCCQDEVQAGPDLGVKTHACHGHDHMGAPPRQPPTPIFPPQRAVHAAGLPWCRWITTLISHWCLLRMLGGGWMVAATLCLKPLTRGELCVYLPSPHQCGGIQHILKDLGAPVAGVCFHGSCMRACSQSRCGCRACACRGVKDALSLPVAGVVLTLGNGTNLLKPDVIKIVWQQVWPPVKRLLHTCCTRVAHAPIGSAFLVDNTCLTIHINNIQT